MGNISEKVEDASAEIISGTSQQEPPKKLKPCCACPETKKARDTCIIENGEENCQHLIEAHKQCMRQMVSGLKTIMDTTNEDQQTRAELREKFLRLVSFISGGTQCDMKLQDNMNYKCKIRGFDSTFEHMIVEEFKTPHPLPDSRAIIRLNDVISLQCQLNKLSY